MLKRSLVFGSPGHLCLKRGQMVYLPKTGGEGTRTIALEDIGFVILEHPGLSLTAQLIQHLNANGTAIVFCNESHHPDAMLLRFDGNTTHAEVLRSQINASLPLTKRLWQQIVRKKILNQSQLLDLLEKPGAEYLQGIAERVRSGDSDNREAMAARSYWGNLIDTPGFRRDPEGEDPNHFLNYGYTVLRAAAARALVGSGLYCAIGLHHRNRYNAFCLADDFMEPYRPFVDRQVHSLLQEGRAGPLVRDGKQKLIEVLSSDVIFAKKRRPLMVALSLSSASLVRCLAGKKENLAYPRLE